MTPEIKALILDLFAKEAIKFGHYTLRTGIASPIYLDLRIVISYPGLLKRISAALWTLSSGLTFDIVCGVPYTALPIATALSIAHDIPMVMRRKELKEHGTKKMIEGVFKPQDLCLIIEDIVTSGTSILETAEALKKEGIHVQDALVIINREQGGKERLNEKGIFLHSLISIFDLLKILFAEKKIPAETFHLVNAFLTASKDLEKK